MTLGLLVVLCSEMLNKPCCILADGLTTTDHGRCCDHVQTFVCFDSSLEAKIVYGYYISWFYFSLGLGVFIRLQSHNCSHLGMDH